MSVELTVEPEIVEPIDLSIDGRLNRAAVGWTRHPLHRTSISGWGRRKRWEYWAIQTPTHFFGLTASNIDYLGLSSLYVTDYSTQIEQTVITPLAKTPSFSTEPGLGADTVAQSSSKLSVRVDAQPGEDGSEIITITSLTDRVELHAQITRPAGHESLGVVIPWSDKRFQYTVKDNTLPVTGYAYIDGERVELNDAWATLDRGRGKWPYSTLWNWGSGSGRSGDTVVGLQFGGKWTVGTGMTENALCIDGRLHKLGEELTWEYDTNDWYAPWRVVTANTDRVDVEFIPRYERADRTQAIALYTETHQCFGHWSGRVVTDAGESIDIDGLPGFAEQAQMRW